MNLVKSSFQKAFRFLEEKQIYFCKNILHIFGGPKNIYFWSTIPKNFMRIVKFFQEKYSDSFWKLETKSKFNKTLEIFNRSTQNSNFQKTTMLMQWVSDTSSISDEIGTKFLLTKFHTFSQLVFTRVGPFLLRKAPTCVITMGFQLYE